MSENTDAVKGITRDQYNLWKQHPVSKLFFQFLKDKQAFLTETATQMWVNGSEAFAKNGETIRGQVIELSEVADMPFEAMQVFYHVEESTESNADGTTR